MVNTASVLVEVAILLWEAVLIVQMFFTSLVLSSCTPSPVGGQSVATVKQIVGSLSLATTVTVFMAASISLSFWMACIGGRTNTRSPVADVIAVTLLRFIAMALDTACAAMLYSMIDQSTCSRHAYSIAVVCMVPVLWILLALIAVFSERTEKTNLEVAKLFSNPKELLCFSQGMLEIFVGIVVIYFDIWGSPNPGCLFGTANSDYILLSLGSGLLLFAFFHDLCALFEVFAPNFFAFLMALCTLGVCVFITVMDFPEFCSLTANFTTDANATIVPPMLYFSQQQVEGVSLLHAMMIASWVFAVLFILQSIFSCSRQGSEAQSNIMMGILGSNQNATANSRASVLVSDDTVPM